MTRKKPIITSVDQAVCENCIYSYQQPISYQDASEGTVTRCVHSKHQGNDHPFCEDGMFLVNHSDGCGFSTASGFGVYYLDDVYEAISNVSK